MSARTKIAFLGLGTMGSGMARRILKSPDYEVTVYNRSAERAALLAAEGEGGAHVARTPAEAAAGADVIIVMVADDAASQAIWLGVKNTPGALPAAKPGAILLDCSTLTIQWVRELATAAAQRGLKFLDAPVTGTKPHAANGELVFFVGGDAGVLDTVRPILKLMSKDVLHLGPSGSGAAIKLVNNFVCGVQAAALAEAHAFIRKSGLDPQLALPIILNGAPGSPLMKTLATRHGTEDATVYFQLQLMAKDLTYALREAQALGIQLATASAALETFTAATAAGLGNTDMSSVIKFRQELQGRPGG